MPQDINEMILSAMAFGLHDSLNPYALLCLVLMVWFLCRVAHTRHRFFWIGLLVVFFYGQMSLLHEIGLFDSFMMKIQGVLKWITLGLGVWVFVRGLINLCCWLGFAQSGRKKTFLGPVFLMDPLMLRRMSAQMPHLPAMRWMLLNALGVAFLLAMVQSQWPISQDFVVSLQPFVIMEKPIFAFWALLWYMAGFGVPLFMGWLLIFVVMHFQGMLSMMRGALALIKLMAAAVYLAVGTGVIYLFFK